MKQNSTFNLLTSPLVISFFLLIILLIVMSNGYMDNDEGMWSYIGRIWSEHNMPPYVRAIENKTPGIFELFAISNLLFGVNIFFVRVLGAISILLSSLTIYLIGRELHSHLAGIFSMVIFGLTMTWNLLDGMYIQTETFMVLFSTLSFYFVIKGVECPKWRFWILSGFSMGLAVSFKQISLTTTIALFIFIVTYGAYTLTNKDKIVGLFLVCLGMITSTFFSLLPLLFSNVSFREYIDGAWLILLNPGSSASVMLRVKGFFHIFLNSRIVVFYPFFGLFIGQSDLIKNRYFTGLLIWMLFDFIGVNASGYYYGHQIKQLIPSVSIIIGILLSNFLLRHIIEKSELIKYASVLLIFIIVLLFPFQSLITNGYKAVNGYVDNKKELGVWLRENTNENDYVYIAGSLGNSILSYCGRISSSKYFNTIFVTSDKEREQLLSDLNEKPPLYFLKPSVDMGIKIEEFLSNNYKLLYTKQEYIIFKRRSH